MYLNVTVAIVRIPSIYNYIAYFDKYMFLCLYMGNGVASVLYVQGKKILMDSLAWKLLKKLLKF